MSTGPVRTAWHPLLVLLIKQLLPPDGFEVTGEFSLTREPLRLDVVVVRKKADARPSFHLLPSLLDGLLPHTLISFKGPTDELEGEDATMLLAYGSLYLAVAGVADPRQVALRVVAAQLTPRFREQIHRIGGSLQYEVGGLWTGRLGPFSLRAIETERAFGYEEEHLWFVFSPSLLEHRRPPTLARVELTFYQYIYQQIAHVRAQGDPLMYKDLELAKMSLEEAMATMMADMPTELRLTGLPPEVLLAGIPFEQRLAGLAPEQRLAGLAPEQRLAGLAPEQRLAGLAPEQRLAGLSPEQRLAGLGPEQRLAGLGPEQRLAGLAPEQVGKALGREGAVLALPDELLGVLPDEVLDSLSPEAREQVRQRIGR